jgi:serine/threonine protein kinase
MIVGKAPFQSSDRMELYRSVLRGQFNAPFYLSPRIRSLLYKLIERNPELRLGCVTDSDDGRNHSADEIKDHPFFSQFPPDSVEESKHLTEEAEKLRREESRRSSSDLTGHIVRRLSHSAARIRGSVSSQISIPCEWSWTELANCQVKPPFSPKLVSASWIKLDRYFSNMYI